MQATIAVPHAILFVIDPKNTNVDVPEYDPENAVAANSACVSVNTRAEVDGDVSIWLGRELREPKDATYALVFDGDIQTPAGTVAVVTSQFDHILEANVAQSVTHIRILVDDSNGPTDVVVQIVE